MTVEIAAKSMAPSLRVGGVVTTVNSIEVQWEYTNGAGSAHRALAFEV